MIDPETFPAYPSASLSRSDIIGYLAPFRQRGWEVYRGANDDQFIVRLADNLKLFIEMVDARWRVSTGLAPNSSISIWAYPESVQELDSAITRGVRTAGHVEGLEWPASPPTVRLQSDEPASNLSRLVALVGSAQIESVYDAYLDNNGLQAFADLASLGVRVADGLRLLTSSKMAKPDKGLPRLTPSFVRAWKSQLGLTNIEIRLGNYSGHQRRFMLLSGGLSLILGPSLNNLSVNEAARLESNTSDLAFFNDEWNAAAMLPAA